MLLKNAIFQDLKAFNSKIYANNLVPLKKVFGNPVTYTKYEANK